MALHASVILWLLLCGQRPRGDRRLLILCHFGGICGEFGICAKAAKTIQPLQISYGEVGMALALRPNCECCDKDLPPSSSEARICSYECTFCADCVEQVLWNVCEGPNYVD